VVVLYCTAALESKLFLRLTVKIGKRKIARRQVADGGDGLQIWRVAANVLNKQSRTADTGVVLQLGDWAGF
jgi:hypothetical protein